VQFVADEDVVSLTESDGRRFGENHMKKTILILGGGFGGSIRGSSEKLMTPAERANMEIVIVNRENYIVFQPLLPEVISGSVQLNHVSHRFGDWQDRPLVHS